MPYSRATASLPTTPFPRCCKVFWTCWIASIWKRRRKPSTSSTLASGCAQGIEDATAKQKIVVELYDKFFKAAFPKLTARLGIVYTPVEVVDFIIESVDEALQSEFGQTLGSE